MPIRRRSGRSGTIQPVCFIQHDGQRVQLVESINKERFWMKTLNQIWLRLNYNVINTYLRQTWRRRRCSMLHYVQYRQFLYAGIYSVHSRYVRVLHLSVDCHILNAMGNICHNFHYIPRWNNCWSPQSCRIHNFYTLRTRNWKQTKQLVQCYAQDSSMPATLKLSCPSIWPGGGHSVEARLGKCGQGAWNLTLFKTQIFDFGTLFKTKFRFLVLHLRHLTQHHTPFSARMD